MDCGIRCRGPFSERDHPASEISFRRCLGEAPVESGYIVLQAGDKTFDIKLWGRMASRLLTRLLTRPTRLERST